MRRSSFFVAVVALEIAVLILLFLQASERRTAAAPELAASASLVRDLGLTDLCLFTEARYTRHPTQADRHVPFQDGPLTLEHFPSGSLLEPPPVLRNHP